MLDLEQIDLLARGGSIALLSLWSWILFRDHRAALSARSALAMNFNRYTLGLRPSLFLAVCAHVVQ
jgi:hypothetical protein